MRPDDRLALGGFEVRRLGFGAMRITGEGIWGPPSDRDEALAVLRRALELGVELIDTADSYGPEVSEELIAEALYPYPDGLVIATKGGLTRSGPYAWHNDARPEHLLAACEGSLRRLRLEAIDVYQLHGPDPAVPFEESVGALCRLRDEGKVREVALSNVSVGQLEAARAIVPVVSVQNRFSLNDRISADVLDRCEELGLGFLPWAPIAAGRLADPGGLLARIADAHGARPVQVAIAWLLGHSPVMVPIPGTGSLKHLEQNLAAASIELSSDERRSLDALT